MVTAVLPELITQLNAAVKSGSPERGDRILKQVTSLFLSNVDRLGQAQIGLLDDVLVRLFECSDATSLAHLSETLSGIELAPPVTVGRLAFHNDPLVATPALKTSRRLSDQDRFELP